MMTMRFETIRLGGGWDDCVGDVEPRGVWFVWGNSGNGKTTAVVSLCRQLVSHGRILYNSKEEGTSLSMQNTIRRFGMADFGSAFKVADMTIDELDEVLSKPRSQKIVVLDSIQFMGFSYKRFREFCDKYAARKLLIFVSRASGTRPEGRPANSAMYDASLKIWVEGYKAFSKGRFFGPTGEITLWRQGAEEYWEGRKNREV